MPDTPQQRTIHDAGDRPEPLPLWNRNSTPHVLTPPSGLSDGDLVEVIERAWGIALASLEYRPVGFGSHHWVATDSRGLRHFVTVDKLSSESLDGGLGFRTRAAPPHGPGCRYRPARFRVRLRRGAAGDEGWRAPLPVRSFCRGALSVHRRTELLLRGAFRPGRSGSGPRVGGCAPPSADRRHPPTGDGRLRRSVARPARPPHPWPGSVQWTARRRRLSTAHRQGNRDPKSDCPLPNTRRPIPGGPWSCGDHPR